MFELGLLIGSMESSEIVISFYATMTYGIYVGSWFPCPRWTRPMLWVIISSCAKKYNFSKEDILRSYYNLMDCSLHKKNYLQDIAASFLSFDSAFRCRSYWSLEDSHGFSNRITSQHRTLTHYQFSPHVEICDYIFSIQTLRLLYRNFAI